MSSPLKSVLANARTALLAKLPAVYLRDTIVYDATGRPNLPDRVAIIDLITDQKHYDTTSVYSAVFLQISCWSTSVAEALDDLELARVALSAADWELERINPTLTDQDGLRGVSGDFTNLY